MVHMADWCGVLVATSEMIYTEMLQSYYKEQRFFLFSYHITGKQHLTLNDWSRGEQ